MIASGTVILDEINQRLPRFRLRQRMLGIVQLHLETHIFWTAGLRKRCRRLLCNSRSCKKQCEKSSFQGLTPPIYSPENLDADRTTLVVVGKEKAGKAPRSSRQVCCCLAPSCYA